MEKLKYKIYTLGCKVNFYESEYIKSLFEKNGYINAEKDVDVCVINTCTVTNKADAKSRKIIRREIKENKNAIIVVMGCYSQISPLEIKKIKGVDIVIGTKDKGKILDLINDFKRDKKQIVKEEKPSIKFEDMFIDSFHEKTRAFVKIQDGCNNFCSYCIIPYSRGPIKSKEFKNVIKEVKSLTNKDYKEIVLTGIHTGKYGLDINSSLSHLIEELIKINKLKRLRLSSIEVNEINNDILNLLKENEKIASHFHIPLQSGTDKILKLMNRRYNTKEFYQKIKQIKKIRKDISITTDVIVGFPGETKKDFKKTLKFIKKVSFADIHVFPYSERKGTKAVSLPNKVSEIEKKERTLELIKLKAKLNKKYMKKFMNKKISVLVEEDNKGHSSNYLKVNLNFKAKKGELIEVKVKKIEYPYVIAEKI